MIALNSVIIIAPKNKTPRTKIGNLTIFSYENLYVILE